jgi:hypothetical protein
VTWSSTSITQVSSLRVDHFHRLEEVPIDEAQADITTSLNANLPHFARDDMAPTCDAGGWLVHLCRHIVVKHSTSQTSRGATGLLDNQILLDVFDGFGGNI